MIAQFNQMIDLGFKYLFPTSKLFGAMIGATALLTSQHPEEEVATKWKFYVATAFVILQVTWYEAKFIFPINDEIAALENDVETRKDKLLLDTEQKHLVSLLYSWKRFHVVRMLLPVAAASISVSALL
jgi:hypothetical protein